MGWYAYIIYIFLGFVSVVCFNVFWKGAPIVTNESLLHNTTRYSQFVPNCSSKLIKRNVVGKSRFRCFKSKLILIWLEFIYWSFSINLDNAPFLCFSKKVEYLMFANLQYYRLITWFIFLIDFEMLSFFIKHNQNISTVFLSN